MDTGLFFQFHLGVATKSLAPLGEIVVRLVSPDVQLRLGESVSKRPASWVDLMMGRLAQPSSVCIAGRKRPGKVWHRPEGEVYSWGKGWEAAKLHSAAVH